jgi:hypothetical protein
MDTPQNPSSPKKDVLHIGGQPAFFRTTSGQQPTPPQLHHHQYQPRTATPNPVAPSAPMVPPSYTPPVVPAVPIPSAETITPASWSTKTPAPANTTGIINGSGLKLPSRPASSPVVPEGSSIFSTFDKSEDPAPLLKNVGSFKDQTAEAPPRKEIPAVEPVSPSAPEKDGSSLLTYVISGIVVLLFIVGGIWAYIQFSYVNQRSLQANKKIDEQIKVTDTIRSRLGNTQNDLALLNEKFNQSVQRQTELFEKQIEIALDQSNQKKQLAELQDQFRQQTDLLKSQMDIIKQQPNLQKRLVEINNQIAQRQITLEKQVQSISTSMGGSSNFSSAVINPSMSLTPEVNTNGDVPIVRDRE